MKHESEGHCEKWARLRFSIIGRLLASPPERGQLQREIEQLAQESWRHPTTNERVRFGASTIERWFYKALQAQDPIAALSRSVRKDAGRHRVMKPALLVELAKQYRLHSSWSYNYAQSVIMHCGHSGGFE